MGELAQDSETRDFQDGLEVNLAGAGRKNERLSREICGCARGLATDPAMGREAAAEVSRGHSTGDVCITPLGRAEHEAIRHHETIRRGHAAENQATGLRLGGSG